MILARALVADANVLILDEPTSALDLKNQGLVLSWIFRLAREHGLTIVFATHQPHHALAVADDVLLMGTGDHVLGHGLRRAQRRAARGTLRHPAQADRLRVRGPHNRDASAGFHDVVMRSLRRRLRYWWPFVAASLVLHTLLALVPNPYRFPQQTPMVHIAVIQIVRHPAPRPAASTEADRAAARATSTNHCARGSAHPFTPRRKAAAASGAAARAPRAAPDDAGIAVDRTATAGRFDDGAERRTDGSRHPAAAPSQLQRPVPVTPASSP